MGDGGDFALLYLTVGLCFMNVLSSFGYSAVRQFDFASLHLTVGLRPMKMKGQKESYVQAQRLFLALHFRTAHCLRHVSVFLFPGVEEVGGSGLAFDGVFLEEVF